ncbi:hypothetical protein D5F52_26525 (plasmid) [Brevibacillus laterosporus]|uniref:hypothetical protein n=1 Tax=Brevibacillus laterosporus TaxID=1465 RepID=UPI000E6BAFB3|nr:hypothetical protein [Brevibacillus laterosporus]AYB41712.1 hypothetical protein D5F52_26525 [Brevibacillus laterosporus]
MDQPIKFEKMEENLSFYFENGYTILSDIIDKQGDLRTVILRPYGEIKYTVMLLRSFKTGDKEDFSSTIITNQDVEILSAYFNS